MYSGVTRFYSFRNEDTSGFLPKIRFDPKIRPVSFFDDPGSFGDPGSLPRSRGEPVVFRQSFTTLGIEVECAWKLIIRVPFSSGTVYVVLAQKSPFISLPVKYVDNHTVLTLRFVSYLFIGTCSCRPGFSPSHQLITFH